MRNYKTHPKDTVFKVSPLPTGPDYSLRHALRVTYPNCRTLGEMAVASANNRGSLPSSPAVALAHAAFQDTRIQTEFVLPHTSERLAQLHAHVARMAGRVRISPVKLPPRGTHFIPVTGAIGFEPKSRKAAMRHPSWSRWQQAENDEIAGIRRAGVVCPVLRSAVPHGAQILNSRFVYTDKLAGPKARWCARGDEEYPYPSASETYASTPTAPAVRVLVSHATQHGNHLYKWDVSQAFTQAEPFADDVHLYIEPPPGHEAPEYVWRLLRPLYGLAVAPARWSATLRKFLHTEQWQPVVEGEDTMYKFRVPVSPTESHDMFLIFHVDDILLSVHPSCMAALQAFKHRFFQRFQAKDEGLVSKYIGIEVHRVKDRTYLTQTSLIQELVDSLHMEECNSTLTPMEPGTRLIEADRPAVQNLRLTKSYQHVVGCLQYLTQWTRPDIGHVTHELSKHQCNPGLTHMETAVRTVRYLKGTSNYGLVYCKVAEHADRLIGFADADWAGDTDTRKSVSANVFLCNGGAVMWHCKQQQGVATSTAEAEFVSASTAGKDAEWLRRLMAGMGMHQPGPTPIYEDNQGCRLMSENPVHKSRTRHIDVAQHKVRDLVRNNIVRLVDCPTLDMTADILTKALPAPAFRRHRDTMLGYLPPTAPPLPRLITSWRGA